MKRIIKDIIAAILLLAAVIVCVTSPFGEGSSWQYVANFAAIFIVIPGALWISDFPARINPELYQ